MMLSEQSYVYKDYNLKFEPTRRNVLSLRAKVSH